jgi:hypothetical protein
MAAKLEKPPLEVHVHGPPACSCRPRCSVWLWLLLVLVAPWFVIAGYLFRWVALLLLTPSAWRSRRSAC